MPDLDRRPTLTKPQNINSLTGLRFVAALVVVLTHSHTRSTGLHMFGPSATNAVTFFFVLSGFILTYIYQERIATIGTWKFYIARFARIWPLHLVCIALVIWVDWFFGTGGLVREADWQKLATHIALIQSWVPIDHWAMQYNGPAWSISTELGFYISFPLLILIAKRGYGKMSLACFCVTVSLVAALQIAVNTEQLHILHAVEIAYVNPLIRVFDFSVGMWIADHFIRRKKQTPDKTPKAALATDTVTEVLALLLLGFLFYIFNYGQILNYLTSYNLSLWKSWLSRGGGVLPGYIAVIWVFSRSDGLLNRFLSKPLLVYLGEISFALYLVQIAVLEFMKHVLFATNLPAFYFAILAVSLSIGLSMLLYALVEMPLRQMIVAVCDFNWRKAADSSSMAWRNLLKGNIGFIGLTVSVLSCGLIYFESNYPSTPKQSQSIQFRDVVRIANQLHGVGFEPVDFEHEATLLWLQVKDTENTVNISLWWQLDDLHRSIRFMHFCDKQGNMLSQGYSNAKQFVGKPGGASVVEEIRIKKTDIRPSVRYIGIGFWNKDTGTCRAMSGRRQMDNRRLLIAEITPQGVIKIDSGPRDDGESSDADQTPFIVEQ